MTELRRARRVLLQSFLGRRDRYLLETKSGAVQIKERVSLSLIESHLLGKRRIGLFCQPARGASWLRFDFDGKSPKKTPIGKAAAWELVGRVVNVLVMDLQFPAPLIELTRSGEGYAAYLFFDRKELPTFGEVEAFARGVLRLAGLPDDLEDGKGHVGLRPRAPAAENIGQTCFLPFGGLLNGAKTSRFVQLDDGVPLENQIAALESAPCIGRDRLLRAMEELLAVEAPAPDGSHVSSAKRVARPASEFSIENWIAAHLSHEAKSPKTWSQGPRCWDLRACPWSEGHTDSRDTSGAYVAEMHSGAIVAGCQHEACTWAWQDLREHFEPSWTRNRPSVVDSTTGTRQDAASTGNTGEWLDSLQPAEVFAVQELPPEFRVSNFVPKGAVSQTWASRGGYKSWFELALVLHLLQDELPELLFGVPELKILSGYDKVLWLACEESAGRLLYRARRLLRGCGLREPSPGRLIHLPSRGESFALTLANLPQLAERFDPSCIVVDYLTGFRPGAVNGRPVNWDLDNDAAHEMTRPLRQLAAQGVDIRIAHHTRADGDRARGASEWFNSADAEISLRTEAGTGDLLVSPEKMKDGKKLAPFRLSVEFTEDSTAFQYAGLVGQPLSKPQQRIWDFLAGASETPQHRTVAHLAAHLEVDRSSVTRLLNSLAKKKRGRKNGKLGQADVWEAIEPMIKG